MKKILSIMVLCLTSMQAMAVNRLYINDFNIDPGQTVDVSIMLDNDVTDFASFQADMYLPNGLELVQQYNEDDDEYYIFSLTTRARSRMSIGSAVQSDGAVRLMLTQTMGSTVQTIKETSGALVTFQIQAAATATGTKTISLQNIVFTTASATQYTLNNSQTTVTITGSSAPDPEPPVSGDCLYIPNFSIQPGATADVSIMLNNEETDLASFQADMYLPDGLELVQQYNEDDEEYFTFALTTRARSRMSIGSAVQSDGAIRLMLTQTMGSTVQTIKETSGALVTFQVRATASASGTKYINLQNIIFTSASATQYTFTNTQTTVTIGSASPASGLTISANAITVLTGNTQQLVANTSGSATWSSSNSAVATVSSSGLVTAVGPGTASISCSAGGTNASITVNVVSLGDMNQNGTITLSDVTQLVNVLVGN